MFFFTFTKKKYHQIKVFLIIRWLGSTHLTEGNLLRFVHVPQGDIYFYLTISTSALKVKYYIEFKKVIFNRPPILKAHKPLLIIAQ